MIDPVSAVVVGAALGVGWLVGRHARLKREPRALDPICYCGDQYGAHDPKTGKCHAQSRTSFRPTPGALNQDVWVDCPCLRYTGPQPVEQYWVPPAADMRIITAPRPVSANELLRQEDIDE